MNPVIDNKQLLREVIDNDLEAKQTARQWLGMKW
jgi:hypothetical protein